MTPETLPSRTDIKVGTPTVPTSANHPKTIDYPRRFRGIITLGYVTLGVILLSFGLLGMWGATGDFGAAAIVLLLMMMALALVGAPIVVIVSLIMLVVCLRYLVLDRLAGRLRVVAIVTSIVSVALAVALGLYFYTMMDRF